MGISWSGEDNPEADEETEKRQDCKCQTHCDLERQKLLCMDWRELDRSRLDWSIGATSISDGHRVARRGAAGLAKKHGATGIRLTVDGENCVEGLEAGGEGLFL